VAFWTWCGDGAMPARFDEALRAAAATLDLPQPDRARILEEIAGDLEELRAELVRRGVPDDEAETRAVELLAPSEAAIRALVDVHEPRYRWLTRRFSSSVMRRSEQVAVLLVTVIALAAAVVPLARSGLPRDPSPFLIPIISLLAAVLALAAGKAIQLWLEKDHAQARLRSGLRWLLAGSGLAMGCALAGFVFELYGLMLGIEAGPDRVAPLLVRWVVDASVLLGAGLVTVLVGGLCWFVLLHKVEAVERAHRREAWLTGSTRAAPPSPHRSFTPEGVPR
jgi:hypothetical protein